LHDIAEGEQITVSFIDNLKADVTNRGYLLQNIFENDFECKCFRCKIERIDWNGPDESRYTYYSYEWKRMGDMCMQQSRFRQAEKYYDLALQSNNLSDDRRGDILHARAATFLERGQFIKACELWENAHKEAPSHIGIKIQVTKSMSYQKPRDDFNSFQYKDYSYDTLIPSKCFITTDSVLTKEECKQAIQWAEEASKNLPGGWTTSRHYAVPTTDIPVHEIPKMLSWFNKVFYTRLQRLLGEQFGENEVGEDGSAVYIHDAFIVRYDSRGGQRHLPLHRDESTHSFTIALNSLDEYEGGGTYVSQLKRSVKPEQGGVVSFRGSDLLHGGDPVIKGTRYIIVAFCYADLNKDLDQKFKKQKLENNCSNFSFGFQL
jgi:tetratricopeptide (TPR) repeat protein